MKVVDLCAGDEESIRQVANLLMEGFRDTGSNAWTNIETAVQEVITSIAPDRISRIAIADDGTIICWVAGISECVFDCSGF